MKNRLTIGVALAALVAGASVQVAEAAPRSRPPSPARRAVAPSRLTRLEAAVAAQSERLASQERLLEAQRLRLESQSGGLADMLRERDRILAAVGRQARPVAPSYEAPIATAQVTRSPIPGTEPVLDPRRSQSVAGGPPLVAAVGEAPPDQGKVDIAALPEQTSVLTPRGGWYVEPSIQYTRASTNALVFRGVQIVTGVQVGLLQANNVARDTLVESLDVRYGLTRRIELEARAPFVSRRDRLTTVAQRDQSVTQSQTLTADNVGDLEFSARYQFNTPSPGRPIIVGGLRWKTDTGSSPFGLPYDEFGVVQGLATGSGFQSLEPSVSLLLPSDPAVIFASASYIHSFSRDVDRVIGGARVGVVEPGASVGLVSGFGFALNPRFSFSLGYRHNYIFPTYTTINDTRQRSLALQVGSFMFGWSYALTSRFTLASSMDFGVTSDAPDLNLVFRLPIRF